MRRLWLAPYFRVDENVDLTARCSEFRQGIDGAHKADIRDLSVLDDGTFAPRAVSEMTARLRPGGSLVVSVGSRAGVNRRRPGRLQIAHHACGGFLTQTSGAGACRGLLRHTSP